MVITKLQGGLGNQMFQYASGLALSKRLGFDVKVDVSFLNLDTKGVYTKREFELSAFKHKIEIANKSEIEPFIKLNQGGIGRRLTSLFSSKSKLIYFKEKGAFYHKEFESINTSCYLDGFWQNEKYFSAYKEEVLKAFNFKEEYKAKANTAIETISKIESSVSLHIRRGDYVSLKSASDFHGVCSLDYYNAAVQYLKKELGDIELFVFSDDLNWCRDNIKYDVPVNFVELNNPYSEMYAMSQCKHNIIANSSFSWWGAWLNQNKNKIVIGPTQWFKDSQHNPKEILPESWLKF